MTNLKEIGARVRQLRKQFGMAQEDLATTVGVSRSTIAGIETGGDRGGIETIVAIADHFKVPMDWLLARKVPLGGPTVGQLVDRPDELSILRLWHKLPIDEKGRLIRFLEAYEATETLAPTIDAAKVEHRAGRRS